MNWKVPYLNLGAQYEEQKEIFDAHFARVMSSGSFINREDVNDLEKNLRKYLDVEHVICVNSGTDALYLSMEVLDLKSGDEVIVPAHTFVASVASIVKNGLKPVFIDIQNDYNMDCSKIESLISKKTKAIMLVHLNGRSCNMDIVCELARKYELKIIEDSAQALGASYKDKKVGTIGDIGCFSLHPMKNLSCGGDGGFICTNNKNFAEKLYYLRDHGQTPGEKGVYLEFGYNTRLDNLQAAIVNIKFKHLNRSISVRRKIASLYHENLVGLGELITLPEPPVETGIYFDTFNSYVIRVKDRNQLLRYLREHLIEVFVHMDKPVYMHENLHLENANLRFNEELCEEIISLPIDPMLSENQIFYVIDTVRKYYPKSIEK